MLSQRDSLIMYTLTIYFAPHHHEVITCDFVKLIANADVISIEKSYDGATVDEYQRKIQDVSNGLIESEHVVTGMSATYLFDRALLKKLHCVGKRIAVERSPISQSEFQSMNDLSREADIMWKNAQVGSSIEKFKKYLHQFADQIIRRDTEYADQLQRLTEQGARILSVRGSLHSKTLAPILKSKGVSFEPIIFGAPYQLSFQERATMKMVSGKTPTDEDIKRCLIEDDLVGQDHTYSKKREVIKKVSAMSSWDVSTYVYTSLSTKSS